MSPVAAEKELLAKVSRLEQQCKVRPVSSARSRLL